MSEDVEKLKARIAELENQLVEEKEELEWDLKAVQESSEKTVQKLQDEIARMKKEGGSASSSAGGKSDDVKMLTQRALMAERRVAELQEELKRSRNLTPAPVSKAADPLQRQRAEAAEQERDELRKENRALERNLEEKKNALERTKKELEEAKKLKKQLEEAKKESTGLEKELRQLKDGSGDSTKLQEEISRLKEQLAQKEDDWGKLSTDSEQSERKVAQLNSQLKNLDKIMVERDQLAARHHEGLEKIREIESALQEARSKQAADTSTKESELGKRASEAEQEVIRLGQELAQVKVASGQMVEQREREAERLKSDLQDVGGLTDERDALEREAAQLRDELAVTSGERDELAAQIRLLRDDHETQVRPAPEPEKDPFIVATQPAGNPRGAEISREQSDFPLDPDLEEAEAEDQEPYQADMETKRVRFTDGVTEQTDALPSPLEGAPEAEDIPPPAVDSIDDERIATQVSEPPGTGVPEDTGTREKSPARDSQPPMAEPSKVGKKRSRSGLLLKAGFYGILGGLLIAAALYFFPKWFGPGDEEAADDTEAVADSPASEDSIEEPPEVDKPEPGSESGTPPEPDKPEVAGDKPADTPEPPVEAAKPGPELVKAQAFGLNLLKKKKFKKALSFTQGWVDKVPGDPTMRYLHGRALFYRRNVKDAASELEKAVELDPDLHEAYYELGGVYIKLGQTANACACLKTFLKLRPKDRRSKGVGGVLRKLKCSN